MLCEVDRAAWAADWLALAEAIEAERDRDADML